MAWCSRRDEGTPQGGPLSPLLANVMLDEVDKELERRGHRFARYADDCERVCAQRAGGRAGDGAAAALLCQVAPRGQRKQKRGGERLRPQVPRLQSVGGAGGEVKRKVADKPLATFKQTHPRTDPPLRRAQHGGGGANDFGPIMLGWKGYFRWRKPRRSGANSMNGCVTGCGRSSSSTGGAERPCTGNCWHLGAAPSVASGWRPTAAVGGATARMAAEHACSLSPTSTALACPASLNLNYSNRPVRTRMPGGVAGERPVNGCPYAD